MSLLRPSLRYARTCRPRCQFQWPTPKHQFPAPPSCRTMSTEPTPPSDTFSEMVVASMSERSQSLSPQGTDERGVDMDNLEKALEERDKLNQEHYDLVTSKADLSSVGLNEAIPLRIKYARAVPLSPSYFCRQPNFNENYLRLQHLLRTHSQLPTLKQRDVKKVAWKSLSDYNRTIGEQLSMPLYNEALGMAKRLYRIVPELKTPALQEGLSSFMHPSSPFEDVKAPRELDRFGRALGVGRRKTSTARAWVVEGIGEVLINGKPLNKAFGRIHDRESATWPLHVTERIDKYNVWALVNGGGTTGQAEALTLAIAKALIVQEPGLSNPLRRAGCLTRDPRAVERKKPGHVKSRKMPAWVKR